MKSALSHKKKIIYEKLYKDNFNFSTASAQKPHNLLNKVEVLNGMWKQKVNNSRQARVLLCVIDQAILNCNLIDNCIYANTCFVICLNKQK